MKIIVTLLLCLSLISFCGCERKEEKPSEQNSAPIVVMPDDKIKATVNGYKKEQESKTETDNTITVANGYVGNKSTKKFHTSSCQYAKKIKEENLETSKIKSDFADKGYTACKKCNP